MLNDILTQKDYLKVVEMNDGSSVTCERCIGFLLQPCVTLVLKREKGVKHWTHTPVCLNLEYTVQSEVSQAQKAP